MFAYTRVQQSAGCAANILSMRLSSALRTVALLEAAKGGLVLLTDARLLLLAAGAATYSLLRFTEAYGLWPFMLYCALNDRHE